MDWGRILRVMNRRWWALCAGVVTLPAAGLLWASSVGPSGQLRLDEYEHAALVWAQSSFGQIEQDESLGVTRGKGVPHSPEDEWAVACDHSGQRRRCAVAWTQHRNLPEFGGMKIDCVRFDLTVLTETLGPPRVDRPSAKSDLGERPQGSGPC